MNTDEVIKKKRGRKPKNIQSVEAINDNIIITANQIHTENVHVLITENVLTYTDSSGTDISSVAESLAESLTVAVSFAGTNSLALSSSSTELIAFDGEEESPDEVNLKLPKKRGRKPKGGKIIVNSILEETNVIHEPNIILHLKCKFADLEANSLAYDFKGVDAFQFEKNKGSELGYHIIDNQIKSDMGSASASVTTNYDVEFKQLCNKLKNMSYNLQNNNISDKKSDCFWCTCSFDNPPIYIPKYQINNIYQCYGCFCSPECATAFLFKESIDTSTRFERYYLLNHIYNKVYNYTKNIKPAPDPYYTLNKYYGELSIQEYRRLFKSERLLIVVDKPLSRVLPELHEYNDDIMVQENLQNTGKFKIKRKTKQNKTEILNETFNIQ